MKITEKEFMELFHSYLEATRGDWDSLAHLFEQLTDTRLKWKSQGEFSVAGDFVGEIKSDWLKDKLAEIRSRKYETRKIHKK